MLREPKTPVDAAESFGELFDDEDLDSMIDEVMDDQPPTTNRTDRVSRKLQPGQRPKPVQPAQDGSERATLMPSTASFDSKQPEIEDASERVTLLPESDSMHMQQVLQGRRQEDISERVTILPETGIVNEKSKGDEPTDTVSQPAQRTDSEPVQGPASRIDPYASWFR